VAIPGRFREERAWQKKGRGRGPPAKVDSRHVWDFSARCKVVEWFFFICHRLRLILRAGSNLKRGRELRSWTIPMSAKKLKLLFFFSFDRDEGPRTELQTFLVRNPGSDRPSAAHQCCLPRYGQKLLADQKRW